MTASNVTSIRRSSVSNSTDAECDITLAKGGFTPDTEIVTTTGPVPVADLEQGSKVYGLNPMTQVTKPKRVAAVEERSCEEELIELETRRCDLQVTTDHRIPYQPIGGSEYTRVRRAGDLEEQTHYRFLNEWRGLSGKRLTEIDITDLTDEYEVSVVPREHGHTFRKELPDGCEPARYDNHTGYAFDATTFKSYQKAIESLAERVTVRTGPNHHRRPYRFDGDDFIRFIGWFVTEGCVHWSTSSATAQVQIAQEQDDHRSEIADLLGRMGLCETVKDRSISFSTKVYGHLLEDLCGTDSRSKQLPDFVWGLCTEQKQLLLETLVNGDGNEDGMFYTSSDTLAGDVLRLCLELGITPFYSRRGDMWRISTSRVNSGFKSDRNVRRVDGAWTVYRLTLADYSLVMAGRNGRFQWVGVSGLA